MLNRRQFLVETASVGISIALGSSLPIKIIKKNRQTFQGAFAKADVPNSNKRIYPRQVLENVITTFNALPPRSCICEFGNPEMETKIWFQYASHIVTKLKMADNCLIGEIETLNTPYGKVLQNILEEQPDYELTRVKEATYDV